MSILCHMSCLLYSHSVSGFAGQRILVLSVGWKEEEEKRRVVFNEACVHCSDTWYVTHEWHVTYRNTMAGHLLFRSCLFSRQITHTDING